MSTRSAEAQSGTETGASGTRALDRLLAEIRAREEVIRQGGGPRGIERQHKLGRLTARERIALLCDPQEGSGFGVQGCGAESGRIENRKSKIENESPQSARGAPRRNPQFFELGLWAAEGMYAEVGGVPAAGVITGLGRVMGRLCVIVANDATVKAGAFFPMTCKKVLRAQRICLENKLPIIYLVDSAGVFLPMQDEIFPDEDDFGRIFRNNAVISAAGVPQIAAIMGNCVAGGGYLPVMCDTLLMTEGSGLYLAGPALVKAAIGQTSTSEELGGAKMHAAVSGTIDYREPNDELCIERLRRLIGRLGAPPACPFDRVAPLAPKRPAERIYDIVIGANVAQPPPAVPKQVSASLTQPGAAVPQGQYDVRELLEHLLDAGSFDEYKAEYGQSLVCGFARLDGWAIGVVANQRKQVRPARGPIQFPSVIYVDSADKATRFILDCNQMKTPI
ncbi:MAG: acyl-CoA carboxylase subunit beta, partial [Dongiaceae bacterium]